MGRIVQSTLDKMLVVIRCDVVFQTRAVVTATPLFLFTCESLTVIFYLKHAKKITVKLLKMIKHTFRNTTYSKTMRFQFNRQ